jgi:hypothetical protein
VQYRRDEFIFFIRLEPFTFEFFNEISETIQIRRSSSVPLEERFLTIRPDTLSSSSPDHLLFNRIEPTTIDISLIPSLIQPMKFFFRRRSVVQADPPKRLSTAHDNSPHQDHANLREIRYDLLDLPTLSPAFSISSWSVIREGMYSCRYGQATALVDEGEPTRSK